MKSEIELRLQGHLLSEWCAQKTAQSEKFLYETGFDSTYRIIRFSTQTLDSLFKLPKTQDGHWKNGRAGMYEIQNTTDGIVLSCTACPVGLNQRECARMKRLAESCNAELENSSYRLVHWDLSDGNANINQVIEELNQVFNFELSYFETELIAWKKDPTRKIRSFPHSKQELIRNTDLPEDFYIEGSQKQILTNRYERNPKVRARCIAVHGSACAVCGFDFGLAFGEKFSGKIEVHHKKPISEIGESYIVDPVNDLIPVCPNCHMMLHSKPDGVYTIEELQEMLHKAANNHP